MFLQTKNSKKIITAVVFLLVVINFGYANNAHAGVVIGGSCYGTGCPDGIGGTKSCPTGCPYTPNPAGGNLTGPAKPPQTTDEKLSEIPVFGTIITGAVYAFGAVGLVVQTIVTMFSALIGAVYNLVITKNLNFNENISIITVGWKISRDVANMFFILILLFISFTTMLRVSGYETKVLLRRLIVIALLINFSLAAGLMIIDGTNVLGNEFYMRITDNNTTSPSVKILKGTGLQLLFNINQDTSLPGAYQFAKGLIGLDSKQLGQAIDFAKIVWGTVIIAAIFAYVMIFAAIMLLIRFAVLAILLVLMPLAFLGAILPKTENMWNEWWASFLNHAFFFPIHMFMVYFAILFSNEFVRQLTPNLTSNNLLDPKRPALFLGYLIAGVMLVGSILVARRMAVFGSGAVLNWAKMGAKYTQASITSRTIGRIGQTIQAAAPNSYLASRVGGTMAGMGKAGLGGSRTQQTKEKAEFQLAALTKQSATAQLSALKESKNRELSKGIAKNLIDDDKNLAKVVREGDAGQLALLRREVQLTQGEKGIKKLDNAITRNSLTTAQAGIAATAASAAIPAKTTAEFMNEMETDMRTRGRTDAEISNEQEKYWKIMTSQERGDTVSNWQTDPAKVLRAHSWVNKMDPEEKIKANDSIGKTLARDVEKLGPNLKNLPEELKKSALNNMSDNDISRMSGKVAALNAVGYMSDAEQGAVYRDIAQHQPNKIATLEASVPKLAVSIGGKTEKEVIPTINMGTIHKNNLPSMDKVVLHGTTKQMNATIARPDLGSDYKAELQNMYTSAAGAAPLDKLESMAQAFDRAGNTDMASHLRTQKRKFIDRFKLT